MKKIIPDNRHNSSIKKNLREKAKAARERTVKVKVVAKLETQPVISDFSTFLKINKSSEQMFFNG